MYQWIILIVFAFCLWKIPEMVKDWRKTGKTADLLQMLVVICLGIAVILQINFRQNTDRFQIKMLFFSIGKL